MKIYRIINPKGEPWNSGSLPGNNSTLTGFWTPHLECALNLLIDINEEALIQCGGYSWCKLLSTTLDNVTTDKIPFKSGDNERYDKDEIFVVTIKDESKVITEEKYKHLDNWMYKILKNKGEI